jgi:hypothetical protein
MARVKFQKAMKDYPAAGIKKGQRYYYVRIKTGPRSSREMRSLTPFKQSQLTTSEYLSAAYALTERFDELSDLATLESELESLASDARELGEEQQAKFDNMPDSLQQGDTGQLIEERANAMSEWADNLDQAASTASEKLAEFEENQEAWTHYDNEMSEYDADDEDADEPDEPGEERMDEMEVVEEVKSEAGTPDIN